jgi:2-oxoisovalerate dehydrogenase E2 component (dihydrolipoyl transacylase)
LRGYTITLSNFGKFGGKYATPVILPPTVAIIAAGATRDAVVPIKGEVKISKVLPLSITFDHRAVTGGEATRFLTAMIKDLEKAS